MRVIEGLHEFKLRVAVGIRPTFDRLAIGGKTEPLFPQQLMNLRMRNGKPLRHKHFGQTPSAFRRPPQRRHRIAFRRRLDHGVQRAHERRLRAPHFFPPAAFASNPIFRRRVAALQLLTANFNAIISSMKNPPGRSDNTVMEICKGYLFTSP